MAATITVNAAYPDLPTDSKDDWIIDSGAGRHITNNQNLLFNMRCMPEEIMVHYGNGSSSKAYGIGDVVLLDEATDKPVVVLRDVLWEPTAKVNFLSVKQASKAGASFLFKGSSCDIIKGNNIIASAVANINDNYVLPNLYACVNRPSTRHIYKRFNSNYSVSPQLLIMRASVQQPSHKLHDEFLGGIPMYAQRATVAAACALSLVPASRTLVAAAPAVLVCTLLALLLLACPLQQRAPLPSCGIAVWDTWATTIWQSSLQWSMGWT